MGLLIKIELKSLIINHYYVKTISEMVIIMMQASFSFAIVFLIIKGLKAHKRVP